MAQEEYFYKGIIDKTKPFSYALESQLVSHSEDDHLLIGPYHISNCEGGYGYIANDLRNSSKVYATLLPKKEHNIELIASLKKLSHHEHIITLLDYIIEDDLIWFFTECLPRVESLDKYTHKFLLNLEHRVSMMEQMASAVAFIHNLDTPIYHGNIVSENVLVAENEGKHMIKLTGFCTAKSYSASKVKVCSRKIRILDVVLARSEFIQIDRHSMQYDLYSLGVIFFMLNNTTPGEGMGKFTYFNYNLNDPALVFIYEKITEFISQDYRIRSTVNRITSHMLEPLQYGEITSQDVLTKMRDLLSQMATKMSPPSLNPEYTRRAIPDSEKFISSHLKLPSPNIDSKHLVFTIFHFLQEESSPVYAEITSCKTFTHSSFIAESDCLHRTKTSFIEQFINLIKTRPYHYHEAVALEIATACFDRKEQLYQWPNAKKLEKEMNRLSSLVDQYIDAITESWIWVYGDTRNIEYEEVWHFVRTDYEINHTVNVQTSYLPYRSFINDSVDKQLRILLEDNRTKITKLFIDAQLTMAHGISIFLKRFVELKQHLHCTKVISLIWFVNSASNSIYSHDLRHCPVRCSYMTVYNSIEDVAARGQKNWDSLKAYYKKKLMACFCEAPYSYSVPIATELADECLNNSLWVEQNRENEHHYIRAIINEWMKVQNEKVVVLQFSAPEGVVHINPIHQYCAITKAHLRSTLKVTHETVQSTIQNVCATENNITFWLSGQFTHIKNRTGIYELEQMVCRLNGYCANSPTVVKFILSVPAYVYFVLHAGCREAPGGEQNNSIHETSAGVSVSADSNAIARRFSRLETFGASSLNSGDSTEESLAPGSSENADNATRLSNVLMIGIPLRDNEERMRHTQNSTYIMKYKKIRSNVVEEVITSKTWSSIETRVRRFLAQSHLARWRGRIVFNGHGDPNGLNVLQSEDYSSDVTSKPLIDVIKTIKYWYDREKGRGLLIGLDIVFAQCHSNCYTFVSDDINFRVIPLVFGRVLSYGITSIHADLSTFCEFEKSHVESAIFPEKVLILDTFFSNEVSMEHHEYICKCAEAVQDGYNQIWHDIWEKRRIFDKLLTCHVSNTQKMVENIQIFFHGCCHHKDMISNEFCINSALCTIVLTSEVTEQVLQQIKDMFCRIRGQCANCSLGVHVVTLNPLTSQANLNQHNFQVMTIPGTTAPSEVEGKVVKIRAWAVSRDVQRIRDGFYDHCHVPLLIYTDVLQSNQLTAWTMDSDLTWNSVSNVQLQGTDFSRLVSVAQTARGFLLCGKQTADSPPNIWGYDRVKHVWNNVVGDDLSLGEGFSLVSVECSAFVLGGVPPYDKRCLRFNDREQWCNVQDMLEGSEEPLATGMMGKLWALRNTAHTTEAVRLQCLDLYSLQWGFKQSLPDAVIGTAGASLAAFADTLYLVGGIHKCCACYELSSDTWTVPISKPRSLHDAGLCLRIGSRLALLGGYEGRRWARETEELDLVTESWTAPPDATTISLPEAVSLEHQRIVVTCVCDTGFLTERH